MIKRQNSFIGDIGSRTHKMNSEARQTGGLEVKLFTVNHTEGYTELRSANATAWTVAWIIIPRKRSPSI